MEQVREIVLHKTGAVCYNNGRMIIAVWVFSLPQYDDMMFSIVMRCAGLMPLQ